ncbi:hypothetical protein BKP35_11545 [Anaerobacillus arseniciselenatis]|uniref:Intracellular proteinase inhibitor BsuPI domain-containing protein n=1 Tax=Anaerobacillus arseniciselenatis TaxID=85682 RepID=A0A1S2LGR8_9BACI|nr:BsuPI-related putative proteinase inhibitor [Anaerobacillus arseniciselenatis]OIJ11571.1 hypothetical protein BKP35_11545 [Anaerobacillus arseniciselenatis]
MKKFFKVLSSVTLATLIIAACGTADDNENVGGSPDTGYEDSNGDVIYDGDLAMDLIANENGAVTYEFQLTNQTEEDIDLTFSSLQEYDYILKDEEGTTVFQYSDGRMFGEAFVEKTIEVNETYAVEVDLSDASQALEDGTYTLEVWSVANELDGVRSSKEVTLLQETGTNGEAVITETGTFVGQIDNNSVEFTDVGGEPRAFRLTEEVREFLDVVQENDAIIYSYYENEDGQLILTEVIVD